MKLGFLIGCLLLPLLACSNSFQATGGSGERPRTESSPEPQQSYLPRVDEKNPNNANISSSEGCVQNGVEAVNVVLVLDNSGSQKDTDPTLVRRSASLDFAGKLDRVASSNSTLKISIATVSFARDAEFTANRWVKLGDPTALGKVTADINQATGPTRNGTHYAPGLRAAAQLLGEIGTDASKKLHRNFVVFMTDGKPNGEESAAERQSEIASLTSRFDAAMIGVASGTGVKDQAVPEVQNLALPITNARKPKHVGQYIRARNAEDVNRAFTQVFDRIANCQ